MSNYRIFLVLLIAACPASTSNVRAAADLGNNFGAQLLKIIPSDASEFDQFGYAVAIDEEFALVGGLQSAGDGTNGVGSVYLFDVATGSRLREISASDGTVSNQFGTSIALHESVALVGASRALVSNNVTGAAYLFDIHTGAQLHKLVANDGAPVDEFGLSVALDGNLAIVGARSDDSPQADRGSAYLFNISTGQQLFKLTATDGARGDQFGQSVDVDDNLAVVGAYLDDGGSGGAYVFDATTGTQLRKLLPTDSLGRGQFGISIAIDDGKVLVGARGSNPDGIFTGVAYLFDAYTGIQLAQFVAPDGSSFDNFGGRVAMEGGIAIISAIEDDDSGSQSGSAYLFDIESKQLLAKIVSGDGKAGDNFGWDVAVDGSSVNGGRAIVAARYGDHSLVGTGSAYVFDVTRVPEPVGLLQIAAVLPGLLLRRWYRL